MSYIDDLDAGFEWREFRYFTIVERNDFYRSFAWQKIKENCLRRDFFICRICKTDRAITAHHLTYERFGGDEEPKDLISVCFSCHAKIHEWDDESKKKEGEEKDFNEHLVELELLDIGCICKQCRNFKINHQGLNLRFSV